MAQSYDVLRSPPARVIWDGWESTTVRLQQCGWEFAIYADPLRMREELSVMARHRVTGLVMSGRSILVDFRRSAGRYVDWSPGSMAEGPPDPVIIIESVRDGGKLQVIRHDPLDFRRVDMFPEMETVTRSPFDPEVLWRTWGEGAEEIIVEPKTVAALLEEIKHLQQPELAEIRRRNKVRDSIGSDRLVAQIVSFAA